MTALLPIIVPKSDFESGYVFEPITSAVENCIDTYMQAGFSEDMMDARLAGLLNVEWYQGRIAGSGHTYYLEEHDKFLLPTLSSAKIGAETLGWEFGVELINDVEVWSIQNADDLSQLTKLPKHKEALGEFDQRLFDNELNRDEALRFFSVLPDEISEKLISKFDEDDYLAKSEYCIRTFIFLWTSDLVKILPKEEVKPAVEAAMEAAYPGLAEKTRAEKKAAFEKAARERQEAAAARSKEKDEKEARANAKPWWKLW